MKKNILIGKSLVEIMNLLGESSYPLNFRDLRKVLESRRDYILYRDKPLLEEWFVKLKEEHSTNWWEDAMASKKKCAEAGYLSHEAFLYDRDETFAKVKYNYVMSPEYREDFNKTYNILTYFLGKISYEDMSRVMYSNDDYWGLSLTGIFCYLSYKLEHRLERDHILEKVVNTLWKRASNDIE